LSSLLKASFQRFAKLKKAPFGTPFSFFSGERGIRTPGGITHNGFQDRRIRPLCHFSGAKVRFFSLVQRACKKIFTLNPLTICV
jgi:hypothetical protein